MLTRIKSIYLIWGGGFLLILIGNIYDAIFPNEPVKDGFFEGITSGGLITFTGFALFILWGFWRFVMEIRKDVNRYRDKKDNSLREPLN